MSIHDQKTPLLPVKKVFIITPFNPLGVVPLKTEVNKSS